MRETKLYYIILLLLISNIALANGKRRIQISMKNSYEQNYDTMKIYVASEYYDIALGKFVRMDSSNLQGCVEPVNSSSSNNLPSLDCKFSSLADNNEWSYSTLSKRWSYRSYLQYPNYWGYGKYKICFMDYKARTYITMSCKTFEVY